MTKAKKLLLIASPIIIILSITVGGIYIQYKNSYKNYCDAQAKRIDLFFESNLNDYQNLKISKIERHPMGGYIIYGHINNNKDLYFKALAAPENDFQFEDSMGYSGKIAKMFKPSGSQNTSPSKLIKEKHLNKEDYEADPPSFF